MKKQVWLGLCATLLLVTAQSIFAVSPPTASTNPCVFKKNWQPESYKTSKLLWISNATDNGWYKVSQQQMGCNGSVCNLQHVLGKSHVSVCQGQNCYSFPGNGWDLNLARSYCSYAYQKETNSFATTPTSTGGPLW